MSKTLNTWFMDDSQQKQLITICNLPWTHAKREKLLLLVQKVQMQQ